MIAPLMDRHEPSIYASSRANERRGILKPIKLEECVSVYLERGCGFGAPFPFALHAVQNHSSSGILRSGGFTQ